MAEPTDRRTWFAQALWLVFGPLAVKSLPTRSAGGAPAPVDPAPECPVAGVSLATSRLPILSDLWPLRQPVAYWPIGTQGGAPEFRFEFPPERELRPLVFSVSTAEVSPGNSIMP